MNANTKKVLRFAGFGSRVDTVEMGFCPICDNPISLDEFEDRASLKEYEISGMCQNCQNKMFS